MNFRNKSSNKRNKKQTNKNNTAKLSSHTTHDKMQEND